MARFNKFPLRSEVEAAEAAATAASGVTPTLKAKTLTNEANGNLNATRNFTGFNLDGDWISIPDNISDIQYFNNSDVLQFSVTLANVNAAVDFWVGFVKFGALVYGIGIDTGTAPDTLYTFTFNQSGTVVNIGNDQLSSDFADTARWATNSDVSGATGMQIDGNIFLRVASTTPEEVEININTGAIISGPTVYGGTTGQLNLAVYKTSNGTYIGGFDSADGNANIHLSKTFALGTGVFTSSNAFPLFINSPLSTNGAKAVQWGNDVMFARGGTGLLNMRAATISNFNSWADSLATLRGLA